MIETITFLSLLPNWKGIAGGRDMNFDVIKPRYYTNMYYTLTFIYGTPLTMYYNWSEMFYKGLYVDVITYIGMSKLAKTKSRASLGDFGMGGDIICKGFEEKPKKI